MKFTLVVVTLVLATSTVGTVAFAPTTRKTNAGCMGILGPSTRMAYIGRRTNICNPTSSSWIRSSKADLITALTLASASGDIGASDFGTAMPERPVMSMKERLVTSSTDFIESFVQNLGPDLPIPDALRALQEALNDPDDTVTLAKRIYEMMIEQGMCYDQDPDTGTLSPTQYDIKSMLDVEEVKQEFLFLYKYGMNLITTGFIPLDDVKEIVSKRLIERTGLTPEEFDEWLGF